MVVGRIRRGIEMMRTLQERQERQHRRMADLEREVTRLSPQLAALEQRVEELRSRLEQPVWAATTSDATNSPFTPMPMV